MKPVIFSSNLSHPIDHVIAINDYTFAVCKNIIHVFDRVTMIDTLSTGSDYSVQSDFSNVLLMGSYLLASTENRLFIWDCHSREFVKMLELDADFVISAMVHPSTYVNKLLLANHSGRLILINIITGTTIYEFEPLPALITTLTQTPALDVIAVGLANGHILLKHLKFGSTLRTFDQQSLVTSVAFRSDPDGVNLMVSGDPDGNLNLWDLELGRLLKQLPHAHAGWIHSCVFLPSQPVLLTSATDNSIKLWIWDSDMDKPRIWKKISGHSKPAIKVRYLDSEGKTLVTSSHDGTLRKFSTIQDQQNMEFSLGGVNKIVTAEDGEPNTIITFDVSDPKLTEWDNVVTCHANDKYCRTWTSKNCVIGSHALASTDDSPAKVVCVSACGNFAYVGSSLGGIDMFNIQSGLKRRVFDTKSGHTRAIVGLASDSLNKRLASVSLDSSLKIWTIATGKLETTIQLPSSASVIYLNRDSNLLALACDDIVVRVVDMDTLLVVREFLGHTNRILDVTFSPDSRFLASSSLDGTLKVWDLPTSSVLTSIPVDDPVTSIAYSPEGSFLATTHVNQRGIVLWADASVFGKSLASTNGQGMSVEESLPESDGILLKAAETDENESLVRLSSHPLSRVLLLMNIENFKKKKLPEKGPTRPEDIPFFLGAMNTPALQSSVSNPFAPLVPPTASSSSTTETKIMQRDKDGNGMMMGLESFAESKLAHENLDTYLQHLSELSPAGLDLEIRSLSRPDSRILLEKVLERVEKGVDFEFMQSIVHLYLTSHNDEFLNKESLGEFASFDDADHQGEGVDLELLELLQQGLAKSWTGLEELLMSNLAILDFVRS